MSEHQHHDHDHEGSTGGIHTHLTSVGIDIGSSTSHLMFSRLVIGYPAAYRKHPEVLQREVIARSPILLTPFSGDWNIEAGPLRELVEATFRAAGLRREEIDTGAVIVTGEAARRENARKIAELFSDEAGRFVCATAGPRLETIMAAHGSGAVERSREEGSVLLNVDIGGGTTKIGRINRGRIEKTVALNIGARLLACDERGRLVRIEKAGRRFLEAAGSKLELGDPLERELCMKLAGKMAEVLFDLLEGGKPPWPEVFVNSPVGNLTDVDGILFSGGVSEYIYGREKKAFGDLGPYLGQATESQARKRSYEILDSSEGIRATVIGASQYSVQLSGETIFVPDPARLPLHNLRVFVVRVNWEPPVAEKGERAVREALAERDPEVCGTPHVLLFSTPPFVGYSAAQELARGIGKALAGVRAEERPNALVFEQNVGRVAGELLAKDLSVPCIDEVSLSELDFIDIGEFVQGEDYVPVVVKSLAFGA